MLSLSQQMASAVPAMAKKIRMPQKARTIAIRYPASA
jgi:hypothetical protein